MEKSSFAKAILPFRVELVNLVEQTKMSADTYASTQAVKVTLAMLLELSATLPSSWYVSNPFRILVAIPNLALTMLCSHYLTQSHTIIPFLGETGCGVVVRLVHSLIS